MYNLNVLILNIIFLLEARCSYPRRMLKIKKIMIQTLILTKHKQIILHFIQKWLAPKQHFIPVYLGQKLKFVLDVEVKNKKSFFHLLYFEFSQFFFKVSLALEIGKSPSNSLPQTPEG